jgi:hypothetical protein
MSAESWALAIVTVASNQRMKLTLSLRSEKRYPDGVVGQFTFAQCSLCANPLGRCEEHRATAKQPGCGRDRRRAATRVIDRHAGAGLLVEQLRSPGCVRNSRGRYAVARQARALRGE